MIHNNYYLSFLPVPDFEWCKKWGLDKQLKVIIPLEFFIPSFLPVFGNLQLQHFIKIIIIGLLECYSTGKCLVLSDIPYYIILIADTENKACAI